MDLHKARQLAHEATRLIEYAASFYAQFGAEYRMKPGSPDEAWALDDAIRAQQVAIAQLLDDEVLEQPFRRCGAWWAKADTIPPAITREIGLEAFNLIGCCAYQLADPDNTSWSPVVQIKQAAIAGMLHPAAVQLGFDKQDAVAEAV